MKTEYRIVITPFAYEAQRIIRNSVDDAMYIAEFKTYTPIRFGIKGCAFRLCVSKWIGF